MCCVLGYAGHDLSKEKFTELLMRTASRGPDDQRVAETEFGLLGFGRLAIMGLTPEGMQPFFLGEDAVICNGAATTVLSATANCMASARSKKSWKLMATPLSRILTARSSCRCITSTAWICSIIWMPSSP